MKKTHIILFVGLSLLFIFSSLPFSVQASPSNPNEVTSTFVQIPDNVLPRTNNIKYDHTARIHWDRGYRAVSARTQATRFGVKMNSYSRARFERPWYLGGNYHDTGRVNSTNGNASYAITKYELYNNASSGKAATYYGPI